mmetsp:Transcript_32671/g.70526  ORF Transcript_32671/g.70526 Transcript_32671/m.70526 type:complete len:217 (+) Transcript_32671:320-970(+)
MIAEEEASKKKTKKTTKAHASNLSSAAWERDGQSDRRDSPRPARKGVADAATTVVVVGRSIRDIPLADSSRRRPLPPPKRRREDTECDVVRVGRAAADVVEDDEDDGRDGDGALDELETHGDKPMPPDCGDCTLPTVVVDCRPDDEPGGEDDEVRVLHDPRRRVHGGDEDGILDGTCYTMDEDDTPASMDTDCVVPVVVEPVLADVAVAVVVDCDY